MGRLGGGGRQKVHNVGRWEKSKEMEGWDIRKCEGTDGWDGRRERKKRD